MTKIPTLEEILSKHSKQYGAIDGNPRAIVMGTEALEAMKEAITLHVQAAEKAIINSIGLVRTTSEKLNSEEYKPFITDENGQLWTIDIKKILKAYPLENIK